MVENVDTSAADLLFGDLAAVDDTPGDSHNFELVPGVGDDDNAKFTIDDDLERRFRPERIFDRRKL